MQSNLIKFFLFVAFLVCLYLTLIPSAPDNAKPELKPESVPQQVTENKSFSQRDTASTSLAAYIDACIADGNDPLPDTSEDYAMNDLKEVDRFFDAMSEPVEQGEQKLQKLVSYYRNHPDDALVALEIIRVCTAPLH
ncbi:hypothetical protein [Alteromonas sp. H39]|uniref:hypothetical protein n=1 Tax=Alteromonas sp. H39 TaxID=3389876 RepID=UPI0039E02E12